MSNIKSLPRRIVCLTEETTETLYLLGEQDRIVGVSGYTVRPPDARQKPKVAAYPSGPVNPSHIGPSASTTVVRKRKKGQHWRSNSTSLANFEMIALSGGNR